MRRPVRVMKFILLLVLAVALTLHPICSFAADSSDIQSRLANAIVLYIGSPDAYVNNAKVSVDSTNLDVYPVTKGGRTLVPVRFLSEKFGAGISWDSQTSTATITYAGKTTKLTLNSKEMFVNGNKVLLDVPPENSAGRIFIPLRKLAEDVLGKKVFFDRGLIIISDNERIFDINSEQELIDEIISRFTNGVQRDDDNMELGNPSGATTSTSNPENYLMVKPQYDLSYNNSEHEPNWVSWHLDSGDFGKVARKDNFRADTTLPSGWYEVTPKDFTGSGFDKGHMCPSADRTLTPDDNSATFLMTNMIPQAPKNNQVTWGNLEDYCRTLVTVGNELYIICGGCGEGGAGSKGNATKIGNGVIVPANTWKVIVVLSNGDSDISRITTSTRVIAVLMPNNQTCNSHPWGDYRVSVDTIESSTGYNFLSAVPADIQSVIEAKVDDGPTS